MRAGPEVGSELGQLAPGGVQRPHVHPWVHGDFGSSRGSQWLPFKLITLCSGEQYGNWKEVWRESTHAHTHAHCSGSTMQRRPPLPRLALLRLPRRWTPGAAPALSRPASAPLPAPPKFQGCLCPPRSAPGKQAGRRPSRSRGGEDRGSSGGSPGGWKRLPQGFPGRWRRVGVARLGPHHAPPPLGRGVQTLGLLPPGRGSGTSRGRALVYLLAHPPRTPQSAPAAASPLPLTLAPQAPTLVNMTRLSWCFSCVIGWGKYFFSCLLPLRFCLRSQVSSVCLV